MDPNSNRQPTAQQLKDRLESFKQDIDSLATPEPEPVVVPDVTPDPEPQVDLEPVDDEPIDDGDGGDEGEPEEHLSPDTPTKPEPKKVETPKADSKEDDQDWKKMYADSSREGMSVYLSKKQLEDELNAARTMPEPTEAELREHYKEWDDLSDFEKTLASESYHNKKINNKVSEILNNQKVTEERVQKRTNEIETFLVDPDAGGKMPALEGKEEQFKAFALKPSRANLDLEDVARLFLMELPKPVKHKGQTFETGSGGPNERPKPKLQDKLTPEQGAVLRNTDYRGWVQALKAGKISNEVG